MKHPDYYHSVVNDEYFECHPDFAKKVIADYNDKKEKNGSWFGPMVPFVITHPKLTTNAFKAMRILKQKE